MQLDMSTLKILGIHFLHGVKDILFFFDDNGNIQNSFSINEYMAQGYRVKYANESIFISGLSEEASNFILIKMDLEGNVI